MHNKEAASVVVMGVVLEEDTSLLTVHLPRGLSNPRELSNLRELSNRTGPNNLTEPSNLTGRKAVQEVVVLQIELDTRMLPTFIQTTRG
jgi:hypothetical protein